MIATACPTRPRLPTVFSIYEPIEEFWKLCGPVREFGSDPEKAFNPLDACLTHLILDLLPNVPVLIDLAVESTGGASSVLGLQHPRVPLVVAGSGSRTAAAQEAFQALEDYQREHCPGANFEMQPASELLGGASLPPGSVILVDARTLEPNVLAEAIGRWCDAHPAPLILIVGLGALGLCPALDAVVRACPIQGTRRFWLARDLEGALAASGLGIVAAAAHADADDVLYRIQQLYTSNHQFLDLLRIVNQAGMESAQLDADVLRTHPTAWALNGELNEWKRKAEEGRDQAAKLREQVADAHRRITDLQVQEIDLRRMLEQTTDELAKAILLVNQGKVATRQLSDLQQSAAFRAALRLSSWRRRLAPENTWRFRLLHKFVRAVRIWRTDGLGSLLWRAARKCVRLGR